MNPRTPHPDEDPGTFTSPGGTSAEPGGTSAEPGGTSGEAAGPPPQPSPPDAQSGAVPTPQPPSYYRPAPDEVSPPGFFGWIRRLGVVRGRDRWIGGVASGIAQRLGVDPLIVRGALIVLTIFAGVGGLRPGLAWALLPEPRRPDPCPRRPRPDAGRQG